MIEFLLTVPIVFSLVLALLEFSVLFVQIQRVSALSREAANAAFRDCSTLSNDPTPQLDACIDGILNPISQGGASILSNFAANGTLIVSIYQNGPVLVTQRTVGGGGYFSQYPGRPIDANLIPPPGLPVNGVIPPLTRIAIGEAFYTYTPLTIVGTLLGFALPGNLYETTIY